jgi:hypothetical protein
MMETVTNRLGYDLKMGNAYEGKNVSNLKLFILVRHTMVNYNVVNYMYITLDGLTTL